MNKKRNRLQIKYLFTFIVMVLVIVSTSTSLVFTKICKDVEKNYKSSELNKTDVYSEQLNNWMIKYETIIEENAKRILSIEDRDKDKILNIFDSVVKDNEEIVYTYVVYTDTKQNVFSDRWEPSEEYLFEEREFYAAPLEAKKLTYIKLVIII